MKKLLLPLLLLLSPLPAIASPNDSQIPANYMIWRDKLINLDHLWGRGVIPVITPQPTVQPTVQTESREVRDNRQRVAFENARSQILQEYLRNAR